MGKKVKGNITRRHNEYNYIFDLALNFFEGDFKKAKFWMETDNPHLGGSTPMEMIINGRFKKLAKWVENALEENKP